MFFSSDRIIPPKDMFRDYSSYVEKYPTSQMSKEEGDKFFPFVKKYCEICKRERMGLGESLIKRSQALSENPNCNLSWYRDFLKSSPNHKMSCLESSILIKDALESCNIRNSVIIFSADVKESHEKIGHVFNVYWYRGEMFVCDMMAPDGPYMCHGYLSSVIPFKEYMYILSLLYENIKLFGEKENNFWNLNFDMKIDDLKGFSEIKMTISKN